MACVAVSLMTAGRRRLSGLVAVGIVMALGPAQAQTVAPHELPLKLAPRPTTATITAADLMTRLYIYADDSMEGRRYLTRGNVRATNYIARELRKLKLEPAGENGTYFQTLPYDSANGEFPARNVVAILRGTDPKLNHTYVAIGAHNDHIGMPGNVIDHDSARTWRLAAWRIRQTVTDQARQDSLIKAIHVNVDSLRKIRPARRDSIANGADDDGSGTVTVLEIAEALKKLPAKPKRSILFVFHTGEESGMLGSRYFLKHPTVPRDSIVAQLNIDMVGRGSKDDTPEGGPNMLMVVGSRRLSTELGKIVDSVNTAKHHDLRLDYAWDAPDHPEDIYHRSDHFAYAERGIPVAFFFTGLHVDYHRSTDEPQYIDYGHMEKIARYIYDLTLAVGDMPKRPVVDHAVEKVAD